MRNEILIAIADAYSKIHVIYEQQNEQNQKREETLEENKAKFKDEIQQTEFAKTVFFLNL